MKRSKFSATSRLPMRCGRSRAARPSARCAGSARQLEEENHWLKRVVADLSFDKLEGLQWRMRVRRRNPMALHRGPAPAPTGPIFLPRNLSAAAEPFLKTRTG